MSCHLIILHVSMFLLDVSKTLDPVQHPPQLFSKKTTV